MPFPLQIINASSEVNLLYQSVTTLYPSGTQAHFLVFRYLLSYFSQGYIPDPSTKDRNEYHQPAQGCNSSSVKADETCKHSIYTKWAFFDLHQIIHCCWIKQNKACIVAINYSAMLSILSELECWRNLKLQSFTGASQMTLPYVILSYQWTFTQWSLASKFPLSLLSYEN